MGIELRMGSGRVLDITAPTMEDIEVHDLVYGLANLGRFSGRVPFLSVAEHSIEVARRVRDPEDLARQTCLKLWALLHDAPEVYLRDTPRSVKDHVALIWDDAQGQTQMESLVQVERRWMRVIARRFDLYAPCEPPEDWPFCRETGLPSPVREADEAQNRVEFDWFTAGGDPEEPMTDDERVWVPELMTPDEAAVAYRAELTGLLELWAELTGAAGGGEDAAR